MTQQQTTSGRRRRGALAGAGACLGWVLHDLVVFAQLGDPTILGRMLLPSAALVLVCAAAGWLVAGSRRRAGLAALALAAACVAVELRDPGEARRWLPRSAFLLFAPGAAAWVLARRTGWSTLALAVVAGAAACLAKTVYRNGWLEESWPLVVALVPLAALCGARAELRVLGGAMAIAVAAGWTLLLALPDLRLPRDDLAPPSARAPEAAPNVLLVVLDTVRADHLAPYGYGRDTTPLLDRRVAESFTLFEQARSTSSWTLPSHASMMTGLLPSEHGAAHPGIFAQALSDDAETVAERLRAAGWRTAAIPSNQMWLRSEMGFGQGFEHFDGRHASMARDYFALVQTTGALRTLGRLAYRDATQITDLAIAWLEAKREGPFFLFLNYMEAHEPYLPPRRFDGLFEERGPRDPWAPQFADQVLLYDRELRYLDEELERLFAWLERSGRWRDTAVVVTSDHGEGLGDHGLYSHGLHLFEGLIRVPLYVKEPGTPRRRYAARERAPVTGADVYGILLHLAGLAPPPELGSDPGAIVSECLASGKQDGQVLRLIEERSGLELSHDVVTWLEGDVKFLVTRGGEVRAHDLARDPGEEEPLALRPAAREAALRRAETWWSEHVVVPARSPVERREGDDERLRALGYGSASPSE